ncbi:MAG TPA: SRPBCC family protein [Bryobacteraceae bacterium]|jgi:uncharacterized protein YndB with AHSA1/START domain|nr:SRPBCC family protein [Bryobacteraceae bacterium]
MSPQKDQFLNNDVLRYIGAVTRHVETRDHNGQPAKVVKAACSYDTTIADVWDALTNVERIPRWFMPISGDLHLGGRYQLEGNAGGQITRCEPPRSFDLTWEYGGDVSWVSVRLSELSDGGTRLELEHVAHVPEPFWDEYGPGAVGVGWDLAIMGLGQHLTTGATVDPKQAAAWPTTDEGRVFVKQSSDGWCDASVLAGTDAANARSAADRTTGFYTGTN